jgi:hypothetical protein
MDHQEHLLLEAFLLDNQDLDLLEQKLGGFNIFEAVGMVRQEVRHSAFLAYLLDPQREHGLGDAFLTRLLQEAVKRARDNGLAFDSPVSPIDLALWSLDSATVLLEWNSIDILVLDSVNQLAVIIENKIFTGEHDNQLARYYQIVRNHYPDWKIIGLYLSPSGVPVIDETQRKYTPIDYELVCSLLVELMERRAGSLGDEAKMVINHYIQLVQRYIVSDEIPRLCREIYRKHKQAIDLIIQNIPDQQSAMYKKLEELIKESDELEFDPGNGRSFVRFTVRHLMVPQLRSGEDNTLYFHVDIGRNRIRVLLLIAKGNEDVRQNLHKMAWSKKGTFQPQNRTLGNYGTIATHVLLSENDFENIIDTEDLATALEGKWHQFRKGRLQELVSEVENQPWLEIPR